MNSTGSLSSSLTFSGSGSSTVTIKGDITSTGVGNTGVLPDVNLAPGSGGISIDKPGGTITFGNDGSNSRALNLDGNGTVTSTTTLTLSRIVQLGFANPHLKVLTVNGSINGGATGYVIGGMERAFARAGTLTSPTGTTNS